MSDLGAAERKAAPSPTAVSHRERGAGGSSARHSDDGDAEVRAVTTVSAADSPGEFWNEFWRSLPADVRGATHAEQLAYFRRLLAARGRATGPIPARLPHGLTSAGGDPRASLVAIDKYRAYVAAKFRPRHPVLYETPIPDSFVEPEYLAAIKDGSLEALASLLTPVAYGVYTLRILTKEWAALLLEESEHFQAWASAIGLNVSRPNSMNNYGVILDDMGLSPALDDLMERILTPLTGPLFPDTGGGELDSHHGFLVDYEVGKDVNLAFHVDDSEVTLNLCLGHSFTGGSLFFRGQRCRRHMQTGAAPEEEVTLAHEVGTAVLHLGHHRHGALSLTAGRRTNLILWCRSSAYRLAQQRAGPTACPVWCALHAVACPSTHPTDGVDDAGSGSGSGAGSGASAARARPRGSGRSGGEHEAGAGGSAGAGVRSSGDGRGHEARRRDGAAPQPPRDVHRRRARSPDPCSPSRAAGMGRARGPKRARTASAPSAVCRPPVFRRVRSDGCSCTEVGVPTRGADDGKLLR